ncbi:MAG: type IX secretion system sortase PorU [Calditrichia bacterium]
MGILAKSGLILLILVSILWSVESEIKSNPVTNGVEIQFNFEEIRIDTLSKEGNEFHNISISRTFPLELDEGIELPAVHFSTGLPADVKDIRIDLQVNDEMLIKNFMPEMKIGDIRRPASGVPGSNIQLTGFDNVFGIMTREWNFIPVKWDPVSNTLRIIKSGKLIVRYNTVSNQPAYSYKKLSGNQNERLKSRIHNVDYLNVVPRRSLVPLAKSASYDFSIGSWFNLAYSKDGLYKISKNNLSSLTDLPDQVPYSYIRCFGYQGTILQTTTMDNPEGLQEIPFITDDVDGDGIWDGDEYIYFFGRALNHYEFDQTTGRYRFQEYYFDEEAHIFIQISDLNSSEPLAQISNPTPSGFLEISSSDAYFHLEESKNNILSSGLEWYGERFSGLNERRTIQFNLEHMEDIYGSVQAELRLKGGFGSYYLEGRSLVYHYFDVFLNDSLLDDNISIYKSNIFTGTYVVPSTLLKTENALTLDFRTSSSVGYAYFDYLDLKLQRSLVFHPPYIEIFSPVTPGSFRYNIQSNSASANDLYLLEVTDPMSYKWLNIEQENAEFYFYDSVTALMPKKYILASKSQAFLPENIGVIPNHVNLRDPSFNADILIITPPELVSAAERLKNIYAQSMSTPYSAYIANTQDIYYEFSSGSTNPLAIRNYIRYLAYNGINIPKYVVLLGSGHFDYNNILYSTPNYIPPYEKESSTELNAKPLDVLFTDLERLTTSLSSVIPDIPIGRIPVESLTEAEIYLDKFAAYQDISEDDIFQNRWRSQLVLVADDEKSSVSDSESEHVRYSEELISYGYIPNYIDINKVYLVDYPVAAGGLGRAKPAANEALLNLWNSGTFLINYFGHGNPTTWADETVFTFDRDQGKLLNGYRNPIIIAGTCDFGVFDQPNNLSASKRLLTMQGGGAIAVISATRPSYGSLNRSLALNFFSRLFKSDPPYGTTPLGEAFMKAVAATGGQNNTQNYNVLGLPTLQPVANAYEIHLDSLSEDTLKALATIRFTASVRDSNHNIISSFNGKSLIILRDAMSDTNYFFNIPYRHSGSVLYKGVYTVNNGIINGEFIIPKSIKYSNDNSGKILFYALSGNSNSAIGYKDQLIITGSVQGITDAKGPDISLRFNENPGFIDGDILPPNATLVVETSDAHGINTTNETGHEIVLILDETQIINITDFFVYEENSYQKGVIEYTLPPMSTGRHTLKLRIWDNLNNVSEYETHFEVISAEGQSSNLVLRNVVNYPNPMTQDTWFTFSLLNSEPDATVKINIYTLTGRLIRSIETILSAPQGFQKIYWDGRDEEGDYLANGVYLYKVIVDNGAEKKSKIEKLMILK